MKTEKEKMLSGELYEARDQELKAERLQARILMKQFNDLAPSQKKQLHKTLRSLCPASNIRFFVQPPFYCDYGYNIQAEEDVFLNFNCTVLDIMPVIIGARTLIGPNVQIYTALHPMDAKTRATGLELAKPVTIGKDVWIGGGAIICPGVTIGDDCVIGAGSVVTHDIQSNTFAAGNPCKPIRTV